MLRSNPPPLTAQRLFVGMKLSAEAMVAVAELQGELRSRLGTQGIRWVHPGQLHLTLRFLGDVPRSAVEALRPGLAAVVEGIAGFELTLTGLGCFPDARRPRVLWLGLEGQLDVLRSLHAGVNAATRPWGKPEDREFQPHLTLARIQPRARLDSCVWRELEQRHAARRIVSWRVESLHLMRSDLQPAGAIYTEIAVYTLGASTPVVGAPEEPRPAN